MGCTWGLLGYGALGATKRPRVCHEGTGPTLAEGETQGSLENTAQSRSWLPLPCCSTAGLTDTVLTESWARASAVTFLWHHGTSLFFYLETPTSYMDASWCPGNSNLAFHLWTRKALEDGLSPGDLAPIWETQKRFLAPNKLSSGHYGNLGISLSLPSLCIPALSNKNK